MNRILIILFFCLVCIIFPSGCKVLINPTPEIVVSYDDIVIESNLSLVDFGDIFVGNSQTLEFTIKNVGNSTLHLVADPQLVNIENDSALSFSIDQANTASDIFKEEFTTFTITYNPHKLGKHSAKIMIFSNDDDDYHPFTFNLLGQGVLPEINVKKGNEDIESGTWSCDFGVISVWDTSMKIEFTIENQGTCDLLLSNSSSLIEITGTNATMFIVDYSKTIASIAPGETTTFSVAFHPTRLGFKTATVSISNNDLDENPYTFDLTGLGVNPDINVVDHVKNDIPNGTGVFDFVDVIITKSKTFDFWIQNLGTYDLEMTGSPDVQITGPDKDAFSITWQPLTLVMAGTESLFRIQFHPTELRIYTATIYIPNSDFDENPYTFTIKGRGTEPEINIVDSNAINIPNSTGVFNFGSINLGQSASETFTILNTGSHELELTGSTLVVINENYYNVFEITKQPASTIAPSGSTTFVVKFTPKEDFLYVSYIEILNNDLNDGQFIFQIVGRGAGPEISIQDSQTNDIANNTGSFDFGGILQTNSRAELFTIKNSGSSDLILYGSPIITITGSGASAFKINSQPSTSNIPKLSSTFFEIEFDPNTATDFTATVTFTCNDTDESTFTFNIYGICTTNPEPEINVKQEYLNIRCNSGIYAFETVTYGFNLSEVVFTIENLGTAELKLTGSFLVEITGSNSSEFTLDTSMTSSSVTIGGDTTFTIRFNPTSVGDKSATITIRNNDSDENPYVFDIQSVCYRYVEGDLNGDGISDLTIGTPNYNFIYEDVGSVHVFFGSSNLPGRINANVANIIIRGTKQNDKIGEAISCIGDVNNDGYHDLIISSTTYNDVTGVSGGIFIFFGRKNWKSHYDASDADVVLYGASDGDLFGISVSSSGDVNNDGINDIVVGASQDDDNATNCGCSFIFFGRSNWSTKLNATNADVKLYGNGTNYYFGNSVTSEGDINNDGIDDIIVGSSEYGDNNVYVFFGRQTWSKTISASYANVIIKSKSSGDIRGGNFSTSGDVNGDNIDDLVLGAPNDRNIHNWAGYVYIFYGRTSWSTNLESDDAEVMITGNTDDDEFGCDVKIVRDLNNDNIGEILVGANHVEDFATRGGAAYLFLGSTQLHLTEHVMHSYLRIIANESDMYFGVSVAAGDWNNDSIFDLIVTAPSAKNSSNFNTGCIYAFYGNSINGGLRSPGNANVVIEGDQQYEYFGSTSSCGK